MSLNRRFFWSVATVAAFAFLYYAYANFASQAQADMTLAQVNGDNTDVGVARIASHDYSGYIVAAGFITVFAIWAGALKQLICRIAAER